MFAPRPPGAPPRRRDKRGDLSTSTGGSDDAVQSTNDDAQVSKLSCVRTGYLTDDFVQYFVSHPMKRAPMINRGYYARVVAIDHLLSNFLAATDADPRRQVLCLGAGFDTRFFQLSASERRGLFWVDVDFASVLSKKASRITTTPALFSQLENATDAGEGALRSTHYALVPCDLRETTALDAALRAAGMDPAAPTFLLSECVMIYMPAENSRAILEWASRSFPRLAAVLYENIRPDDAFGAMMIRNFEARGIPLQGIRAHPDLPSQRARFLDAGLEEAFSMTMRDVYDDCIRQDEKARVSRLELFDEFEDWNLLMEHYCLAGGAQGSDALKMAMQLGRNSVVPSIGIGSASAS